MNHKSESNRQLSIALEIQKIVSSAFAIKSIYHPELEDVIFSFPIVKITPDLKVATIFTSCLDKNNVNNIIKILNDIAPNIKKIIASKMKLRYVPGIKFIVDNITDKEIRIEKKIDMISKN